MLDLYQRIRNRRQELNMTQDELAKKLGYKSRSSINKIELGANDIPQSKIIEFARALDTSPDYLMGWSDRVANDAERITDDESRLVSIYRRLNPADRRAAFRMLSGLCQQSAPA